MDSMFLFQIIEWISADLDGRGQCFILLILDKLLSLVKTQKEKAFICLQIIHMIKKLEVGLNVFL